MKKRFIQFGSTEKNIKSDSAEEKNGGHGSRGSESQRNEAKEGADRVHRSTEAGEPTEEEVGHNLQCGEQRFMCP